MKKLFIDTAPFIYLMEGHPQFAARITKIIADAVLSGDKLSTSIITLAEFGVMPTRTGRHEVIKSFETLLESLNIEILVADKNASHWRGC